MGAKVRTIPEGYSALTPYLCCKDAGAAIDFYKAAFGATEVLRLTEPSGRVGHAELRIGDALIMISDEYPEMDVRSPKTLGGSAVMLHLYVDDVDAFVTHAVAAGAILERAVADQFYGDRSGQVIDPFGHRWDIGTHVEDVSLAEVQQRFVALYGRS